MTIYLIRTEGTTVTLSSQEVSPTDNIAMPMNCSALTEAGWAVVAILCGAAGLSADAAMSAVIDRLRQACATAGMTLVNNIAEGATE